MLTVDLDAALAHILDQAGAQCDGSQIQVSRTSLRQAFRQALLPLAALCETAEEVRASMINMGYGRDIHTDLGEVAAMAMEDLYAYQSLEYSDEDVPDGAIEAEPSLVRSLGLLDDAA